MVLTALDITDKEFRTEFRGYSKEEVNEFLDLVAEDYERLILLNREQEQRVQDLEDKLAYFGDMKESLTQSVILAQETAEKVKVSARTEYDNLMKQATHDSRQLIEEAKIKANQILREATDDAKRVAVETEDLKRQSRAFHQRLLAVVEGQLGLVNSPEWQELLQPTAVYLQNSDAAFKEVVEKVLNEKLPEANDAISADATRQFSPEEIAELNRRIEEGNAQVAALEAEGQESGELFSGETQTFKLNI